MGSIDKILDASVKLFARQGFENTSIQGIADSAGVAAGTIIYHFKTKKNLLFVVLRKFLSDLVDVTQRKCLPMPTKWQEIELFVNVFFEYSRENKNGFAAYENSNLCLTLENSMHLDVDIKQINYKYRYILERMIKEGKCLGEFIDVSTEGVSSLTILMLFSVVNQNVYSTDVKDLHSEVLSMLHQRLVRK